MPQPRIQFFTMGAERSRRAWGTVGTMPAWKRTLLLMALVVAAVPLFVLMLVVGVFMLAMAITTILIAIVGNKLGLGRAGRDREGATDPDDQLRKNVRVIGEHPRR